MCENILNDSDDGLMREIINQINADLDQIAAWIDSQYQNSMKGKTMTIKFKKLDPKAVEPRRATAGAAGFDMTATSSEICKKGKWFKKTRFYRYHTGIAIELPPGWSALAFPRSSIVKTGAMLGNSVGVIDSDYRGEITFCFKAEYPPYSPGERIGQLVIVPVPDIVLQEAVELSETARGSGGYGSTGA